MPIRPRFEPMPLARFAQPFDLAEWIFEPKLDGFRALAHVANRECKLVSRNRHVFKTFPALSAGLGSAIPREAVLDGEIVYLAGDGGPSFYDLMRRRSPQFFYAFDLLWLDGEDLRSLPLLQRKRRLAGLVRPPALYVEHFKSGTELFGQMQARDMEGIVAKLASGPYDPKATTWVKIKNPNYSQVLGRRELFDRLRAGSSTPRGLPQVG